jgi:hypothetical protein
MGNVNLAMAQARHLMDIAPVLAVVDERRDTGEITTRRYDR